MLNRIVKFAGQVAESALSVVGVRTVEEPHHIRRPLTADVEIRRYGPRIAAETTVAVTEDSTTDEAVESTSTTVAPTTSSIDAFLPGVPEGEECR